MRPIPLSLSRGNGHKRAELRLVAAAIISANQFGRHVLPQPL